MYDEGNYYDTDLVLTKDDWENACELRELV